MFYSCYFKGFENVYIRRNIICHEILSPTPVSQKDLTSIGRHSWPHLHIQTIDATMQKKKKKLQNWGNPLVSMRSWRLKDSKNGGHCPWKATWSLRNCKKKLFRFYCQFWTPTSLKTPFWWKFGQTRNFRIRFQAINEIAYSWHTDTSVTVESVNLNFYSNLSFWEVGVGSWQFFVDTQKQPSSHL